MSHIFYGQMLDVFNSITKDAVKNTGNVKFMLALKKQLLEDNGASHYHYIDERLSQLITLQLDISLNGADLNDAENKTLAESVSKAIHTVLDFISRNFPKLTLDEIAMSPMIRGITVKLE